MTDETEKKGKRRALWIMAGVVVIGLLITIALTGRQQTSELDAQCCERICGEFNQQCRGWNLDTLECTYNYERYGYPTVNQIFSFVIDAETKNRVCYNNGTLVPPKIQVNASDILANPTNQTQ